MLNFDRITLNPAIMGGKACVRGMRVTVGMILEQLAAGQSKQQILDLYPYLEAEDIAQAHGHIVVTHDLDFTHLLALTRAAGPSVILPRWQFAAPENAVSEILRIATSHKATLSAGALIVIDTVRSRVRILPIRHAED